MPVQTAGSIFTKKWYRERRGEGKEKNKGGSFYADTQNIVIYIQKDQKVEYGIRNFAGICGFPGQSCGPRLAGLHNCLPEDTGEVEWKMSGRYPR